jgi:hypothetical protein
MDEQEQAQQALKEMFRHDRAEVAAHPPRKPRWQLGPLALPWLLAIAVVIFVLGPFAFIVIYPRFGPVDTMTAFCTAEGDGEYETAYELLSQRAQQHLSLDVFTRTSRSATLESCSTSGGVPFIFGGTHASLDVNYLIVSTGSELNGTMAFVRENGAWRVDSMTPDLFGISS